VTEAVDRLPLRELVEAYALAVDRPDPAAVAALFAADGELVLFMDPAHGGETGRRRGRDEIEAAIRTISSYEATHHTISSTRADIDGDTAAGESRCEAHHLSAGGDHVLYLHYLDSYRREAAGWRFTRREVHVVWSATHPVD
jgi:ketosteroid isomerase-like protein